MSDQNSSSSLLSEYLTKAQLAKELRKSERTLDRWHNLRIGPPRVIIGRTVLYRIDAVLDWLKSRERSEVRASKSNG
jgi:hypothetical protein